MFHRCIALPVVIARVLPSSENATLVTGIFHLNDSDGFLDSIGISVCDVFPAFPGFDGPDTRRFIIAVRGEKTFVY